METKSRKQKLIGITLLGSLVNFGLLVFKFIAGFLGNSGAMIADAVHSLSDFFTDVIVLTFVSISSKPRDEDHKYGHGKYETLATAIIGVVLFFVGAKLLWDSGNSIYGFYFRGEELSSPGGIALVAALVSILAKEILFRCTLAVGKKQKSQSVIANAWHHRLDALSSIGTALGIGGAILLGERWNVLDPIAAVLVSILIVKVAIGLLLPAINELLEKSLPPAVESEILRIVSDTPGVSDPNNLHTRCIGNNYAIELNICVPGDMPVTAAHELTCRVESRLRERYGERTHINLHIEPCKIKND